MNGEERRQFGRVQRVEVRLGGLMIAVERSAAPARPRRRRLGWKTALGALAVVLVPGVALATNSITYPATSPFQPNTAIKSAEVNANFDAIKTAFDDHNHAGESWTTPTGTGLTVESTDPNGRGIIGYHSASSGQDAAIYGGTLSQDPGARGVEGVSQFTTAATASAGVVGSNLGTNAEGYGVQGNHVGNGIGVFGNAAGGGVGIGVSGFHSAATGTGAGVSGTTNSGDIGSAGVLAVNTTTGATSNNSTALTAHHSGSGDAIYAYSDGAGGVGVLADGKVGVLARQTKASGAALAGQGLQPTGVALQLSSTDGNGGTFPGGAIQIVGAGVGTTTAAFIHKITAASRSGACSIVVGHPQLDNSGPGGAIVFVTHNMSLSGGNYSVPVGIQYSGSNWFICREDGANMTVADEGQHFNVLIIKP